MSDPLFINAVSGAPSYTAAELRRGDAAVLFPGVTDSTGARGGVRPGHTPASLASTTWTVHNIVGAIYPGLTSTSGPYRFQHAEESGSLDPADGTNDRIDALDLQIRDNDEDGSGFRDSNVVYTAGTPGASPSAPAQAANSIRLATILVPAGGTPAPTLTVVAPWTVAAGGVLPVRDSTERPTAGLYGGMGTFRQDTGDLDFRHAGAWATVGTAVAEGRHRTRTVDLSVANATVTTVTWNSTVRNDGGITETSGVFTIDRPGWYHLSAGALWASNSTGNRQLRIKVNTSVEVSDQRAAAAFSVQSVSKSMYLSAGDTVEMEVEQTSGAALNLLGAPRTFLSAIRIHP